MNDLKEMHKLVEKVLKANALCACDDVRCDECPYCNGDDLDYNCTGDLFEDTSKALEFLARRNKILEEYLDASIREAIPSDKKIIDETLDRIAKGEKLTLPMYVSKQGTSIDIRPYIIEEDY